MPTIKRCFSPIPICKSTSIHSSSMPLSTTLTASQSFARTKTSSRQTSFTTSCLSNIIHCFLSASNKTRIKQTPSKTWQTTTLPHIRKSALIPPLVDSIAGAITAICFVVLVAMASLPDLVTDAEKRAYFAHSLRRARSLTSMSQAEESEIESQTA
jgi:hypothetical protein